MFSFSPLVTAESAVKKEQKLALKQTAESYDNNNDARTGTGPGFLIEFMLAGVVAGA